MQTSAKPNSFELCRVPPLCKYRILVEGSKNSPPYGGQTNRVFLNLSTKYSTNRMAIEIKKYFEDNSDALEVLVAVGNKVVSVERTFIMRRTFFKEFRIAIEK